MPFVPNVKRIDPRGVECRFLGYAGGTGNYKVQDILSRRVFVSRDVIFEEGQPHRTSPSVGKNVSLFDTTTGDTPLDDATTDRTDQRTNMDPLKIIITIITLISPRNQFNKPLKYAVLYDFLNLRAAVLNPENTNNGKRQGGRLDYQPKAPPRSNNH